MEPNPPRPTPDAPVATERRLQCARCGTAVALSGDGTCPVCGLRCSEANCRITFVIRTQF